MHYFLGTLALLGVGFIGLLIETHKQDKQYIKALEQRNYDLEQNQKTPPWNKGKKGYKIKKKEVSPLLEASVSPQWEQLG